MAKRSSGATRALDVLAQLGIDVVVHEYVHDPAVTDFGGEAAHALNVPAERVFKTLFTEVDGAYVVALVPVSGTLNLKALAAAQGGKRAVLAEAKVAERKTGYVLGGVSPFGQRALFPTVLDESARAHETIYVSAGRRGLDLEIPPSELVRVLGAMWAPIAQVSR